MTGTRDSVRRAAHDIAPLPLPEVATDASDSASSAKSLQSLQDASSVHDRGNGQRCSVTLEEPGAHVRRERPAIPRGMSPDRSPQ